MQEVVKKYSRNHYFYINIAHHKIDILKCANLRKENYVRNKITSTKLRKMERTYMIIYVCT
jgi:hypothetical protein